MKPLVVRVKKGQWYRGNGDQLSRLKLKGRARYCCIGFLAQKLGATEAEILDAGKLNDVESPICQKFHDDHFYPLSDAYRINDSQEITDDARISKLRALGKKMNVKFVFVP